MSVDKTIEARAAKYGEFRSIANVCVGLDNALSFGETFDRLEPYQVKALEMICMKMARIVNGDPNYADNWHDIAGYAKLVEERL